MAALSQHVPAGQYGTNLVGVPTALLANVVYNDEPLPLRIAGVHEMYSGLFEMLGQTESLEDAARAFHLYMTAIFGLDAEQRSDQRPRRQFRSSYVHLLQGWGIDSNSREGAVLKGWVESRFGLVPTFHHEALERYGSAPWMTYVTEKMASRFHNNAIQVQLDLLYEFCQWALARFKAPGQRHLTLCRGVNDFSEHPVLGRLDARSVVARLNNLSSFTDDSDIAAAFGDVILTARVPLPKILYFPTLLTGHGLIGEAEYLVIGGDYRLCLGR